MTTSAREALSEKMQVGANLFRLTVAYGYDDAIPPSTPLLRR
jgi:hypothetical protein